jgi:hypothetical protein
METLGVKTIVGVALAVIGAAPATWAGDAVPAEPGVYQLEPETGPFVGFKESYREVEAAPERPASVQKAPEGKLRYYVFPWGNGDATVALSDTQIVPDSDGDGDLAEEVPIPRPESYEPVTFILRIPLAARTIEARLQLRAMSDGPVRLTNLTRMSGKVPIGGRLVAISLNDYLTNGRYDDYYTTSTKEYWLCDHVHLDLDSDGKFKDRIPPTGEDFSLAHAYFLSGTVYSLEVLDRGERLRFGPRETRLATVSVNAPEFQVAFVSDEYGACHMTGKEGAARLPEGRYQLDYSSFKVADYRVDGYWKKEDGLRWLDVTDGLQLGLKGPLRYELYVEPKPDGSYALSTSAFGPNGERVELYPPSGGRNVHPTIRVATEKGEELFSVASNYC